MGFPGGSAGKESACNAGDLDSIPELGRSPGEGNGYPLQYSGLESSMDYSMGSQSQTQLSDFHFHYTYLTFELNGMSCVLSANTSLLPTLSGAPYDVPQPICFSFFL